MEHRRSALLDVLNDAKATKQLLADALKYQDLIIERIQRIEVRQQQHQKQSEAYYPPMKTPAAYLGHNPLTSTSNSNKFKPTNTNTLPLSSSSTKNSIINFVAGGAPNPKAMVTSTPKLPPNNHVPRNFQQNSIALKSVGPSVGVKNTTTSFRPPYKTPALPVKGRRGRPPASSQAPTPKTTGDENVPPHKKVRVEQPKNLSKTYYTKKTLGEHIGMKMPKRCIICEQFVDSRSITAMIAHIWQHILPGCDRRNMGFFCDVPDCDFATNSYDEAMYHDVEGHKTVDNRETTQKIFESGLAQCFEGLDEDLAAKIVNMRHLRKD